MVGKELVGRIERAYGLPLAVSIVVCPEVSVQSVALIGGSFAIELLLLLLMTSALNVIVSARISITPAWDVDSLVEGVPLVV